MTRETTGVRQKETKREKIEKREKICPQYGIEIFIERINVLNENLKKWLRCGPLVVYYRVLE